MIDKMTSEMFIERTKELLKQYNSFYENGKISDENYFNITLLINCLYGLLMMPSKKNYGILKKDTRKANELEKSIPGLTITATSENYPNKNISNEITVEEFVRGLRNGLGHWEEKEENHQNVSYELTPQGKDEDLFKTVILKGSFKKNNEKTKVSAEFNLACNNKNQNGIM